MIRVYVPISSMSERIPLRTLRAEITEPEYSVGTSITTSSIGSHVTPSIFFIITSGRDTAISKPSRRICSSKIVKCNSPRPDTLNVSVESVSSTFKPTFTSSSLSKRSRILREVTNLPTCPANGESLTMKFMESVGSSIFNIGIGSGAP